MVDLENNLQKYASLIIRTGVNLQKDQTLVLSSPVECAPFARLCAKASYQAGAREVVTLWNDEQLSLLKYRHCGLDVLASYPDWCVQARMQYLNEGAAYLSIAAEDPELFAQIEPEKMQLAAKASHAALREFYDATMSNRNSWCVVSAPTVAWARKVFPGCADDGEAVNRLWDAIFRTTRIYEPDPVAAWAAQQRDLRMRIQWLNEKRFHALRYRNSLGTDFTAGLARGHIWCGGAEETQEGVPFIANMPTEEVFTTPDKDRLEGTLCSALPLNYNGVLIEDFSLTFERGRVVSFSACKGEDTLRCLLDSDEGARSLGEVALVPANSPIPQLGILFYNTLYDENASCHFALGEAYASCLEGGTQMSREELAAAGANASLIHVDFMVGTPDLSITGIAEDGSETPVFENGNWAFSVQEDERKGV